LIDNTHDIETSNNASILGSLTLRIIEVSRDGNNSILHCRTQVSLSNFTHLHEHHGRDFLSSKLFLLALVVNYNSWLICRTSNNLKRPQFDITLNRGIAESTTNQPLCICDTKEKA
ncbi:hypothetical protein V8G54_019033, partial [Vigna mungo]